MTLLRQFYDTFMTVLWHRKNTEKAYENVEKIEQNAEIGKANFMYIKS